jgi:TolB-like protein
MMATNRPFVLAVLVALAAAWSTPSAQAQKILAEGVEDLAGQIAASVAKEQKKKIAVLPFRALDGQQTMLGMFLAEELVTNLFERGLDIVERTMLDKVLGEIKLGQSGVIDPETARQVGKVAGVDALVSGTITDLSSYVALNCRLIDAQTGRVFAAAQVKIAKDDDVKKILNASVPPAPQLQSESVPEKVSNPPAKAGQRKEVDGFVFELKACRAAGDSVQCDFLITNSGADRELTIRTRQSRLIDDAGSEHLGRTQGSSLGSSQDVYGLGMDSDLVSGVPIRARVSFEGGADEARSASVVELSATSGTPRVTRFKVQFHNIPLTH